METQREYAERKRKEAERDPNDNPRFIQVDPEGRIDYIVPGQIMVLGPDDKVV